MTAPDTTDLLLAWQELRRSPDDGGSGWRSLQPDPVDDRVLAAVGGEGNPALLILLPGTGSIPSITCPGLELRTERLRGGSGTTSLYLVVLCRDTELEPAFAGVAARLLQRMAEGQTPASALEETLREFRRLLRNRSGISEETAIGLIGELLVLERLLAYSPAAWQSWMGPEGDPRDFRFGPLEIECKSSRNTQDPTVEIHGLTQLDAAAGNSLLLCHALLEADPAGALTVPVLVDRLVTSVSDGEGFLAKLDRLDYSPDDPDPWRPFRYNLRSLETYRVDDRFPCLTAADLTNGLPNGIRRLSYVISMNDVGHCRLDPDEVNRLLPEAIRHAF